MEYATISKYHFFSRQRRRAKKSLFTGTCLSSVMNVPLLLTAVVIDIHIKMHLNFTNFIE